MTIEPDWEIGFDPFDGSVAVNLVFDGRCSITEGAARRRRAEIDSDPYSKRTRFWLHTSDASNDPVNEIEVVLGAASTLSGLLFEFTGRIQGSSTQAHDAGIVISVEQQSAKRAGSSRVLYKATILRGASCTEQSPMPFRFSIRMEPE